MTEEKDDNDNIGTHAKEYLRIQYEVLRLKLIEKVSVSGAAAISNLVITIICAMFLLFVSFAAGYFLSEQLESYVYGFAAISGFYLIVSIVLIIFRKKLMIRPFRDKIIQELMKEEE